MADQDTVLPLLLKPYSHELQAHEASSSLDQFVEQARALVQVFQRDSKAASVDRHLTAQGRLAKVKEIALGTFRTLRQSYERRLLALERQEAAAKGSANVPSPSSSTDFQRLSAEIRGQEVRQRLEALNEGYTPEQAFLNSDGTPQPSPAEKRFLQLCESGDVHVYRSVLGGGKLFEDVISADIRKRGHLLVIGATNPDLREELEVLAEAKSRLRTIYTAARSMLTRAAGAEDPEALEAIADEQPEEQTVEA